NVVGDFHRIDAYGGGRALCEHECDNARAGADVENAADLFYRGPRPQQDAVHSHLHCYPIMPDGEAFELHPLSLLQQCLLFEFLLNIRFELRWADDGNFVGEPHDEATDAFEVERGPIEDVRTRFRRLVFFEIGHRERVFFAHQYVGAQAEFERNPDFAAPTHAEHVGVGTFVELFKLVGLVEHHHIPNAFKFEILALFVLGVERLNRLKAFAEAERLYQPVRYLLAVGRMVVLQHHLAFVFDGLVDPSKKFGYTEFQKLFGKVARLRVKGELTEEVLL